MNIRKLVLLMLPITVAFLVGGMAGSLVGVKEFQFIPAIIWGAMIGIIDYNFSVMKSLGFLGWIGRILLILTSAIITATIGDHIIFADTITEEIEKTQGENVNIKAAQKIYDLSVNKVTNKSDDLNKVDSEIAKYSDLVAVQVKTTCKSKCNEMKILLAGYRQDQIKYANDLTYLRTKETEAKNDLEKIKTKFGSQHNIIKEIQVLYSLIFREFSSMIVFILLSLMVICIETLPLLLKSGLTENDLNKQNQRSNDSSTKKQKADAQTILRNNAY